MVYVAHFGRVDHQGIRARFFDNNRHRATLLIPFSGRSGDHTLCIVGQNPSAANEHQADKTVHFLERYVFEKLPLYSRILMLNLYSRVDTRKLETSELINSECENLLRKAIAEHEDFLFVFGKLKNQRAYQFVDRVRKLEPLFAGKRIHKLDIGTDYAPHPGNRAIHYHNTNWGLAPYDFAKGTSAAA